MEGRKSDQGCLKTRTIVLGAAMSALILSGCSDDTHRRRCVDSTTGIVMEDYYCEDDETTRRYHGTHSSFYFGHYGWYWGGSGYSRGASVRGGGYTAPRGYVAGSSRSGGFSGHAASAGTARGGFGASAAVHGAGGS